MRGINAVLAASAAALALGSSGVAHAQPDYRGFVDFLYRHGEPVDDDGVRDAAINYGLAICDLYASSRSNEYVLMKLDKNGRRDDTAVYTVGSVRYLCPEYGYLLPS
ncbi:DUF732 domain-containing protein [Mycolicibacterium vanbaalenii]|uniref:DUF732 domain-containing protein n=1 Tax=Mycolicibacterium vanbaalenii (strain DSM 7251 / JCM 13017 / BCRC 16820 / KCTC 9966 / NRRL B-24157 / PYR-1) TaxID=350058 RepID=A1TBX1_MYCVP|nr:DUF732 domain-containing protein [Mycolicibacterium vanbaalenii]ABM14671.1 hypothetical protein Mvan_3892 [Mycolicibacterium vanbaalenii PYR-1]MCV7130797.1 DUF732 domain-containing protein [Mycolicibacterium vanbaalenii PYR-1]